MLMRPIQRGVCGKLSWWQKLVGRRAARIGLSASCSAGSDESRTARSAESADEQHNDFVSDGDSRRQCRTDGDAPFSYGTTLTLESTLSQSLSSSPSGSVIATNLFSGRLGRTPAGEGADSINGEGGTDRLAGGGNGIARDPLDRFVSPATGEIIDALMFDFDTLFNALLVS